jgi:hypothetical protein
MISTHLIRMKRPLLSGAIVAALALPAAALAGNGDPIRDSLADRGLVPATSAVSTSATSDWFERYVGAHPYGLGTIGATTSSDPIRDSLADRGLTPTTGATAAPDWFERYADAHPYGLGTSAVTAASDPIRDSLADRGLTLRTSPTASTTPTTSVATPDWIERYAAAHPYGDTAQLRASSGGFDWSDAGVGAGFATALFTLLAGSLFAIRRHTRQRMQVL